MILFMIEGFAGPLVAFTTTWEVSQTFFSAGTVLLTPTVPLLWTSTVPLLLTFTVPFSLTYTVTLLLTSKVPLLLTFSVTLLLKSRVTKLFPLLNLHWSVTLVFTGSNTMKGISKMCATDSKVSKKDTSIHCHATRCRFWKRRHFALFKWKRTAFGCIFVRY